MSDISIPGGRIRSFVERIEHLDTELQELNESKKEALSEFCVGFNQVLRRRRFVE